MKDAHTFLEVNSYSCVLRFSNVSIALKAFRCFSTYFCLHLYFFILSDLNSGDLVTGKIRCDWSDMNKCS